MQRLECINQLLALKDISYGLLEWAEGLTDEEFSRQCAAHDLLPEQVIQQLEELCRRCEQFGTKCQDVLDRLETACSR